MVDVLETDVLFATVVGHGLLKQTTHVTLADGDGTVVATARDRAGVGRWLARSFGNGRRGRVEWDLLDADGNRVLEVVKPAESLRGPSPEVSLADGTLLGRVVPTKRLAPKATIALQRPDGLVIGELHSALGERRAHPILMHRIVGADQAPLGEVAFQPTGAWGFHLHFTPDAPISVRALAIAHTICEIQQRTSGGSA